MKKYLRIILASLALIACVALSACSADSDFDASDNSGTSSAPVLKYSYDISAEAPDVGSSKSAIDAKCDALGGYYENRNESFYDGECSYFSSTYRIPNAKAEEFVRFIEDNTKIEYKDVNSTDVTTSAADTAIEINALETQKLLYEDMLGDNIGLDQKNAIIEKIADITKKINKLEASMSASGYTAISLSVSEEPSTFDEIMGFVTVMIFFGFYPTFVIVAIIVVVVIIRKNKKKKEMRQSNG